jgi:hypothetical protein
MFLSISVTQNCQISSCDTLVAKEWYVFQSQWFKGSPLPLHYSPSFLITLFNGAVSFQAYIPSVEWYRQWRKICPIVTFSITNPTRTGLSFNLGLCDEKMATNHLSPYIPYCISLYIMHLCLECGLFLGCNIDAVLEEALSEMLSPNICTDGDFLSCFPVRMILPYTGNYTLDTASHPTTFSASVMSGNSRCFLLNPYLMTMYSHLSSSFYGMKQGYCM